MYYPKLNQRSTRRVTTDTFLGYNHQMKIRDGEWYFTKNLTAMRYPMFSPRVKRGVLGPVAEEYSRRTYAVGDYCRHEGKLYQCNTAINAAEDWTAAHWTEKSETFTRLQAIIAKDALYWVENGTLYANGYATGLTGLQTAQETQLVSMGAYICVFPDKKYINTLDLSDYGDMGSDLTLRQVNVTYSMCHADGTIYENVSKSDTEPTSPTNGAVWIDTTDGNVKEYSEYSGLWTIIETVYTRVDFNNTAASAGFMETYFKELDGVQITGLHFDDLNGSKILYALGVENSKDYFVVIGIQDTPYTETVAEITIKRVIPDLDFVCEAQNRLWGCRYGNGGPGVGNINEIYCCALGDFKNWEQYLGISTDSWRASCGSDGPWTGCINYLGAPTFFKENIIHQVSISSVGAHQVGDMPARGVQQGSHRSLAIVNETLYYKSRSGIMAYQGGMPAAVGEALGEELYYNAVAGVFGDRYYISMKGADNAWNLFCYDVKKGLWMREDDLHVECFAQWGDELYAQAQNRIIALNGTEGSPETDFEWAAETGIQYYSYPDKKYVSRYNIRLFMGENATMQMFIEYDSSGVWNFAGNVKLPHTGNITIPMRPRRCDHMRLRLEGRGDVRIFSITRVLERGSDV